MERLVLKKDFLRKGRYIPVYLVADAWDGKYIMDTIKHRKHEYARSCSVTWRMALREFVDVELKEALFGELFEMSKKQTMRLVVVEMM